MKIGIIGAGFTGLSAALLLQQKGHDVIVFEKDAQPGGLAVGFKLPSWQWSVERHYHHWFTNDFHILGLAKEIGYAVLVRRPKTSVYLNNEIYQLDSPLHVLTFAELPMLDRLRMAAVLGILKANPIWRPLERIHAHTFLPHVMGRTAYQKIWEPLLVNKFGEYAHEVSLAWFWARIKKRTPNLAYPEGGFLSFAEAIVKKIEEKGGKVLYNTGVSKLESKNNKILLYYSKARGDTGGSEPEGRDRLLDKRGRVPIERAQRAKRVSTSDGGAEWQDPERESLARKDRSPTEFDRVIITLPSFLFLKIAPNLPDFYRKRLTKLKGFGAVNLLLRLHKQFLQDNTYWLNICNKHSPVMAIVEQTNFMDKKYYNNEHIVYLGNYVPQDHPYFSMNETQILHAFDKFLKEINPSYKNHLIKTHLFKAPFAQPIIPVNYSKLLPPFETPLKNVYLANIEQVYPWDRGTNYAVELGEKVANLVDNS